MAYKILLAEDNEMESSALKALFESEGYDIDTVSNGLFALDKVKENDYHLIITDLVMPVSDGIQFIYSLNNLGREIPPVIVITGYDNIDNMLNAYQMGGAIDVAYKPYNPDKLLDLCRKILENRI